MQSEELIDLINEGHYLSLWDVNDKFGNKVKIAKDGSKINIDEHRWFIIATDIYECSDGFVAVTGPYRSLSEHQGWDDIDWPCHAEEVKQHEMITYYYK